MSFGDLGFGPFGVTVIENFQIQLGDKTKIACKIWFPSPDAQRVKGYFPGAYGYTPYKSGDDPQDAIPSILEYLPYRQTDFTAPRDHRRHPWMSSHGYLVIRADMRGSGDSTGLYFDEYEKQEQDDAVELIDWLSNQIWSNGKVGMYGKSWGGFNGLQVAARKPPALKAVISLYSTDHRYFEDIHWKGGCVLGNGLLSWASFMLAIKSEPPHPKFDPNYKCEWIKRLEAMVKDDTLSKVWLEHQTFDDYWKHGSIASDHYNYPECVDIPVLIFGGYYDGYKTAALRMVRDMENVRAIFGPWVHEWPDIALPGPQIGYMPECLDFWNEHLKKIPNPKPIQPSKLTFFQREGKFEIPNKGKWLKSDSSEPYKPKIWNVKCSDASDDWLDIKSSLDCGLHGGEWLSFGHPDQAVDQRVANLKSTVCAIEQSTSGFCTFGQPILRFAFKVFENNVQVNLIARLYEKCMKSGETHLISWGVQNLNRNKSGEEIEILNAGEIYEAEVELDLCSYTFKPGNEWGIGISTSYWPMIWPSAKNVEICLKDITLTLPTSEQSQATSADGEIYPNPLMGTSMPMKTLQEGTFERYLKEDLTKFTPKKDVHLKVHEGVTFYPHIETTIESKEDTVYSITGNNPLSASVTICREIHMKYEPSDDTKEQMETSILTSSKMWSDDPKRFQLENSVEINLNGESFFSNNWKESVERKYV